MPLTYCHISQLLQLAISDGISGAYFYFNSIKVEYPTVIIHLIHSINFVNQLCTEFMWNFFLRHRNFDQQRIFFFLTRRGWHSNWNSWFNFRRVWLHYTEFNYIFYYSNLISRHLRKEKGNNYMTVPQTN